MTEYTKEQQAEHRRIFADALESGRYKQCQGTLTTPKNEDRGHPDATHCCLGVATEEAITAGVLVTRTNLEDAVEYHWGLNNYMIDLLPEPVRHWLGFASSSGHLREAIVLESPDEDEGFTATNLIDLNDDVGWGFAEIARLVREDKIALEGEVFSDD